MPSTKRKLQLLAGLTVLVLLAVGVGCKGFFQNPVLTTLTVGPPSAQIQLGSTLQMQATGTYDDGSTKSLTSGVFWSTSDDVNVPISTSGVVTGSGITTSPQTITASSGTASGTASISVNPGNVTGITVMPSSQTVPAPGGTTTYTCFASITGMMSQDVSGSVTWTVSDTTGNITVTQGVSPATVTTFSAATPGTYTITATWTPNTTTYTSTAKLILN